MATNMTNFDNALKYLYRDSQYNDLTFKRRPLFALLSKFEGFGGKGKADGTAGGMPIPLKYGNPQGRSATFSNAQNNTTNVSVGQFTLTRVKDYSIAKIDAEVIEASKGNANAFIQALKTTIDGAWASLADSIESALFRSGTGSIGQVKAGWVAAVTLNLEERGDIYNFEVGMTLVSTAVDGVGALLGGAQLISKIDRRNGILTGAADWNAAIGAVATSVLYVQGDYNAAIAYNEKIAGLDAWFPGAPATATPFFGQDRSIDDRMAGVFYDGTTNSMTETGIDAQVEGSLMEGAPDLWVMHHLQMRRMKKELENKREYREVNARNKKGIIPTFGFRSVVLEGDYGIIDCLAASKCPPTKSWMIERPSITFNTLGPAPKFLKDDSLKILRAAAADEYEVRLGMRGNLSCNAPAHNIHIALPSPS